MYRPVACMAVMALLLAANAGPAQAQTAPELECVWKGTCPKPAPRPKPPAAQPRPTPPKDAVAPKPAPPAPTEPPRDTATTPPPVPPKDDTVGPAPTPPAPSGPPPVPSAVTARLQELSQGDPQDVLLFFNETPDAPNGLRNPQGQVTFRDGRVAPCAALGWTGGPEVSAAVRTVLERHGATRVVTDVAATSCPEGRRPYDVVAVERRLFQALPPEAVRSLVTDITERRLTPLTTVTASDVAAAQERLRREREIAAGLRNGSLQGMGLLLLGGSTRRICAVGLGEEAHPAVTAAIEGWRADLPQYLKTGGSSVASYDMSAVLAAVRRGECAAIFAQSSVLRDIEARLRADGVPVMPAPVWLTPPQWEALLDRVGVPRTTADRRRLLASKVNPLGERLVAELQAYLASDGKSEPIGTQFRAFADWYGQLRTAGWTPSVESFAIDDYGDASWSGGSLPTASVIVYFALTNQASSASGRNCMVFLWLDDASAGTRRDSTAFSCDAVTEIERWKRQRAMKSKWS